MAPLKEDGSLDIERINNLPIEDYITVIENLTAEQHQYYNSKMPINEGPQHTKAIFVDCTIEDEIKNGAVNILDYLNEKRKKYGIK